jgi:hypothetical protein
MPTSCVHTDATDSIFFLEACMFNQICNNGEELWKVNEGDWFICDFSVEKFKELGKWLLDYPF